MILNLKIHNGLLIKTQAEGFTVALKATDLNIIENLWINLKKAVHSGWAKNLTEPEAFFQGRIYENPSNKNWLLACYQKLL